MHDEFRKKDASHVLKNFRDNILLSGTGLEFVTNLRCSIDWVSIPQRSPLGWNRCELGCLASINETCRNKTTWKNSFFFWELRNMFLSFSFSFVVDEVLEFLQKKDIRIWDRTFFAFQMGDLPSTNPANGTKTAENYFPSWKRNTSSIRWIQSDKKRLFSALKQNNSGNLPNYLKTNLSKVSKYEDIPQNCAKKPYQHVSWKGTISKGQDRLPTIIVQGLWLLASGD